MVGELPAEWPPDLRVFQQRCARVCAEGCGEAPRKNSRTEGVRCLEQRTSFFMRDGLEAVLYRTRESCVCRRLSADESCCDCRQIPSGERARNPSCRRWIDLSERSNVVAFHRCEHDAVAIDQAARSERSDALVARENPRQIQRIDSADANQPSVASAPA